MAKSYDWDFGNGFLVVNKRGVAKQGLSLRAGDLPPRWVSKFGSVTFNQYGRELPNGGLNEAGLAMEVLWLNESRLPPPDERPTLNELQFIEYGLDRFATVAELLAGAPEVRISKIHAAVHYFACDPTGACATLEFLDGKLLATTAHGSGVRAITNNSSSASIAALAALHKAKRTPPEGNGSSARYLRAATMLESTSSTADPKGRALQILDRVSQGSHSKWNILYELKGQKIHFRSDVARTLKVIDLRKVDFACGTPSQILDINTKLEGEVTEKLEEYTTEANAKLIGVSFGQVKVGLTKEAVRRLAEYPAHLRCAAASAR